MPNVAEELRKNTICIEINFSEFGLRKSLDYSQKAKAAQPFGADPRSMGATKKLLQKHKALAAITNIKNRIKTYIESETYPFEQDKRRLLHKSKVQTVNDKLSEFKTEWQQAALELDSPGIRSELEDEAKKKLGSLYNQNNYPDSLAGEYQFSWSYPEIEPPKSLEVISPQIYQDALAQVVQSMENTVKMAEQEFLAQLQKHLQHLIEKIGSGEKKIFRDTAVSNIHDFIDWFKKQTLNSNEEIDKFVAETDNIMKGITAEDLRQNELLKVSIAASLSQLDEKLKPHIVNAPRRKVTVTKAELKDKPNDSAKEPGNQDESATAIASAA